MSAILYRALVLINRPGLLMSWMTFSVRRTSCVAMSGQVGYPSFLLTLFFPSFDLPNAPPTRPKYTCYWNLHTQSVADAACASYLNYVPIFFPKATAGGRTNLAAYMKRNAQRESYRAAFGAQHADGRNRVVRCK